LSVHASRQLAGLALAHPEMSVSIVEDVPQHQGHRMTRRPKLYPRALGTALAPRPKRASGQWRSRAERDTRRCGPRRSVRRRPAPAAPRRAFRELHDVAPDGREGPQPTLLRRQRRP
jgi:hypothetical protein